MAKCSRCGDDIFWAMHATGTRFLRPLEVKGEGLLPEPGEVIIDLVDGEWRAVAVPTARLHRFHDCAGTDHPDRLPPVSPREQKLAKWREVRVRKMHQLPQVPGADAIRAARRVKEREEYEAEYQRAQDERRKNYWQSPAGQRYLSVPCPTCLVGIGQWCISQARDTKQYGRVNSTAHISRRHPEYMKVQEHLEHMYPFSLHDELGRNQQAEMSAFLGENPDLFTL